MRLNKRIFDLFFAILVLLILAIPMLLIFIAIRLTSEGRVLYWSKRVGKNNKFFLMPKFRSMKENTPPVATNLMNNTDSYLTPIGGFIRRYSLDEFPQLFSILKGDMSFVGPRPALFNQDELIALRKDKGVDKLIPGLTGWAQINGRDNISILEKVMLDKEYIEFSSFWFDLKIILITFLKVIRSEGVSH
jgi:O-antigen biosynthesis protein WbqP